MEEQQCVSIDNSIEDNNRMKMKVILQTQAGMKVYSVNNITIT